MENNLKVNLGIVVKTTLAVLLAFIFSEIHRDSAFNSPLSNESGIQIHNLHTSNSLHESSGTNRIQRSHFIAELEEITSHPSRELIRVVVKNVALFSSVDFDFSNGFSKAKTNGVPSYIKYCRLKIPF